MYVDLYDHAFVGSQPVLDIAGAERINKQDNRVLRWLARTCEPLIGLFKKPTRT